MVLLYTLISVMSSSWVYRLFDAGHAVHAGSIIINTIKWSCFVYY